MNWFEKKAVDLAIDRMESKMGQGWMARTGAVGMALGAIGAALTEFAHGTMTVEKGTAYWTALSTALALFGIRRSVSQAADLTVAATVRR